MDRVAYVGHATVLLELGGVRLLTDPVLRKRMGHLTRRGPPPDADAMERLDAVLISHLHLDHLDLPSLRRLGRDSRLIVPRGAARFLRRQGFAHATELEPGEKTSVGGVEVAAVPAEHDSRRRPLGPQAQALGFDVRGPRRVYFAGDTDLYDGMAELRGKLDLALLPVSGWGPRLGPGHLDPASAAQAAELMRPRLAIPIHWGTFLRVGLAKRRPDLLHEPPREFAAQVASLAPDVEVKVLEPGESLLLSPA